MSTSNLLDAGTITFLELTANGKTYRVPPYQRDYSWREEQWEDLWTDLMEIRGTQSRHYMGALVVEASTDRDFLVIDGQQRMATLSLLALAVIKKLQTMADAGIEPDQNRERAKELRNSYIGQKDPASLVESSKLFLNQTDDAFYQDYLVQLRSPLNPRGLIRSNRLLWECFCFFERQINSVEEFGRRGDIITRLLSETIARQLVFIHIQVDDDLSAYTVFETLNARGLELTTTDLLKNYLFSRVRVASDSASLQRRWRALIETVGAEEFPSFLRYHLLCELPKVRSQRLFKLLRERARTHIQVFELIAALEARAELFAAFRDPSHGYWVGKETERGLIKELNLFGVEQMTPLLFAAWEKLPNSFEAVLRIVCVVSFRYTVVGARSTSPLETIYHEAAKAVLAGTATTPKEILKILAPIYVEDEIFRQDFALLEVNTRTQRKKLAKYILARLECDVSGKACDHETDPATIEHILPENPSSDWEASVPLEKWVSLIYRIGNLTLIEPSLNRRVGNAVYPDKLNAYSESRYVLTRGIAESYPDDWSTESLNRRQLALAARATHLWRLDY